MKCEDVSRELIAYLDRRTNSAERRLVEDHLQDCADCRARAEELRGVWSALEELPAIEPSLGFDARVRERVAAEPQRHWIWNFVPQPRLVFAVALLLLVSIGIARLPQRNVGVPAATTATTETEQFQEIKDLPVLENYEVLTKFDALSELSPAEAPAGQSRNSESND